MQTEEEAKREDNAIMLTILIALLGPVLFIIGLGLIYLIFYIINLI